MGTIGTPITTVLVVKADIESFINASMEDAIPAASLTEAIKLCMQDLSNMGLLLAANTSITLDNNDLSFAVPSGYKDVLSITLTNSEGDREDPLIAFPGGHTEYLESMSESVTSGTPKYYSESEGQIYLYPPPDADYDVAIEFQKYDDQDPDNIEFGSEFSNALKFGSLYFYAMMMGRERYVALWQNKYETEKEFRRLNLKKPVCITR